MIHTIADASGTVRTLRGRDDEAAIDAAISGRGEGDRVIWEGGRVVAVILADGNRSPDVIAPSAAPTLIGLS